MERLAIIGTGIAGMGTAHQLQHRYDLTMFDHAGYVGGHTNTVTVDGPEGKVSFDTGFMVFNYVNYPELTRLFGEIDAPVMKTDMSFSVQHAPSGLEYCGSGLNGLFAQRKNLFNRSFIRMLMQITRFNKESVALLDDPRYASMTLGEFIEKGGYGQDMLWKYLIPMSSAVWSTPMELMLDFPAITLIRFFKNHGFLGLNTQHQWYTLRGGSESYKKILTAPFRDRIQLNKEVKAVRREGDKALVLFADGSDQEFDKVVFACHGDQALRMLEQPTDLEQTLLSNFKYQPNLATIHSDESVMPRNRKVWSSWNYRIEEREGKPAPTTIYWMNRLQDLPGPTNYFVSINALPGSVAPGKTYMEIPYEHPLFDLPAIRAQDRLQELNRQGTLYFCGSYFKYGFHEDAFASSVQLCKEL